VSFVRAVVLLAGLTAGEVAAADERPAAPGAAYTVTADGVMAALNDVLAWYRQARTVMQSFNHPRGAPVARDGEQLPLRMGFAAAGIAFALQTVVLGSFFKHPAPTPSADPAGARNERPREVDRAGPEPASAVTRVCQAE
jgi:hypothetical protein